MGIRMTKIICDTRQKQGKHENIDRWFRNHGVEYEYRKLDTGDYATDDLSSNILVDTKKGLSEVAMNCGRDHARFVREMERARDTGYRLVILIETTGNYKSISDVERWLNDTCKRCGFRGYGCNPPHDTCLRYQRRPMSGVTLAKLMRTMADHHGCRFELCHPLMAAKRICDLLGVRYG